MKLYKYAIKTLAVLFLVLVSVACDEDFGEVGTGIVGEVNFETRSVEFDVKSSSIEFSEGVQTNALNVAALGYYNDNVYGTIKAEVLSQLRISRGNPSFGDNTVIDSVILTIPYFSTREGSSEDEAIYTLDSVYGNNPVRLRMFRSNYFLNDLDPDSQFEDPAVYYSNEIGDQNFSGIEGDLLLEVSDFIPDNEEIPLVETIITENEEDPSLSDTTITESRIAPAFRAHLDTIYWKQQILDREGQDVLLNQNNFNDYFRGVYFKVDPIDGTGNYFLFDYENANITIYYNFEGVDDSTAPGEADDNRGTISFGFAGVQINGIENNKTLGIQEILDSNDQTLEEKNIYLQGGDGSVGILQFFGDISDEANDNDENDEDTIPQDLATLRDCGLIINEANLLFYVNQEEMEQGSGAGEPERIFIYNYDDNTTILDSNFDVTVGSEGPVSTRTNHLGRLTRTIENDVSSPGVSYRIRLTRHFDNIINGDGDNDRLAIAISQNVTELNTAIIRGTGELEDAKRVPVAGVISPEGTILHGSNSDNVEKRLKLRIFYTLPEGEEGLSAACKEILGIE